MAESPGDESWRTKPPYQPPDEAGLERQLQGACHCGKVKYWLSRDTPLASKYCHCGDCQTIHGAPFQWAAILHKSDMAFEEGADGLRWYHSGSRTVGHTLPCKVSCSRCGTLIMDEGRNMVLLFPTLLGFANKEERSKFDVQCHIFYPQRVLDIPDGKPKWAGLDGHSEQLALA